MAEKRYYWLKLKEDYFTNPKIKKLRKIAGGDTFTIIYLKMQLLSVSNQGIIEFEGIENTFEEELALKLDEDLDNVQLTLAYLKAQGLVETNNNEYLLVDACNNIGSECDSAKRVREFREKKNKVQLGFEITKKEPKSNALRQRQYQAKKRCEEKQHIPYIEDYINNKRYNGNYYLVIQRDRFKCSICDSIENLCVHHIDGYNEEKPENNETNKMITLCRNCHSNVHSNTIELNEDLLNSIEYYNEMLPSNDIVTEVLQNSISISNSSSISNIKEEKEVKHKYGEYNNVLLKDSELNKLKEDYSNWQELIKYLDEYIEMKGYKAKSHNLAIRKWVVDAVKRNGKQQYNNTKPNQASKKEYTKDEFDSLYDDINSVDF